VTTAYYLVHAMAAGGDFRAHDLQAARAFGWATADASVGRIVYLGDPDADLSEHLRSRQETPIARRTLAYWRRTSRPATVARPEVEARMLTQHLHESGRAGLVGAEEPEDLARRDLEVDRADCPQIAEVASELLTGDAAVTGLR
jgi:hypothetical protein